MEANFNYPVSFNGKTRFQLELPTEMDVKAIEEAVLADERTERWKEGKDIKKMIIVPKRIINIVIG